MNLDEMGPESAKSFLGQQVVHTQSEPEKDQPAERAKQEIDYGRRAKGYIFGAFQPATGEALTVPYDRRTTENWIDFLNAVEAWVPASVPQLYVMLDNLAMHPAMDVLLFALDHPRWKCVFQPTYAAYLNLIEPWWKTLRSLALKGRRFETWQEVCDAIARATAYWNAHRHPFIWGWRRRHRPHRSPGIAIPANVR
ncbi:MAG: hypothetical protein NVSMB44_45850 [Ktedonobacteraceae bacterium]